MSGEIVPCAYCAEPLSNEHITELNKLRKQHATVIPCCGTNKCMLLAKHGNSNRPNGYRAAGKKPKKEQENFSLRQPAT